MADTYKNITGLTPEQEAEHKKNVTRAQLLATMATIMSMSIYGITGTHDEGHPYLDPRVLEDVDD